MKTTIFLHVGDSKTGTSYIQNFLDVNRSNLFVKHSCLYPNFNSKDLFTGRCHNHHLWYRDNLTNVGNLKQDVLRLKKLVDINNIEKVIFSDESWLLDQKSICFFTDIMKKTSNYQIKIIAYLRRMDSWFESAWKQWGLKVYDSCEEYAKQNLILGHFKGVLNYLEVWKEIIGIENIIVRPYEKQQLPKGLMYDFLNIIGIDLFAYDFKNTEKTNIASNVGFNRDVIEILHYCRELFSSVHDNHLFHLFAQLLGDEFQKKPFEDYHLLPPKERLNIIHSNLPFERQIARKFMDRPDEKIFYDPLPNPDDEYEPYSGLTLEKALPIIIKMIDKNNRLITSFRRKK